MVMVNRILPRIGNSVSVAGYLSQAANMYGGFYARKKALGSLGGASHGKTIKIQDGMVIRIR